MRRVIYAITFFVIMNVPCAYGAQEKGIRIIISTTGKAAYSAQRLTNPLRITVEFSTKNVFSSASGETVLNNGILSKIKTEFYEDAKGAARPLRSLTFYLLADAPYRITQEADNILIDIFDRDASAGKTAIELAGGRDAAYLSRRNTAIDIALANIKKKKEIKTAVASTSKSENIIRRSRSRIGWQDISYLALLSLSVFLLIRVRRDWADFKRDALNKRVARALYEGQERRKWWRHDLRPLGRDCVSLEFVLLDGGDKKIKVAACDIGYGGVSFQLPILHRRLPFDKPVMVNIALPDGTGIETEGTLIWQRSSGNIFRHSFGVVFTKHLHSEWDKINRFIEARYASLSS